MSRPHDNFVAQQERDYMRLKIGGPGARAHAPDEYGADDDSACRLWIRRRGWMARVEPWMIEWVASSRRVAS